MNEYCTLNELREWATTEKLPMGLGDDDRILQYISLASRELEKYCGKRKFYPRIETRWYNYQGAYEILVDDDLLEVTTLTSAGSTISASDYLLYPLNDYPKYQIQILKTGTAYFDYDSTLQKAISVAGTWGYHDEWDNAWLNSGDTVQDTGGINATVTTVTVADIGGINAYGFGPRFSRGQLLKIESEWLAATAINMSTNKLTVLRGVNGSTAAPHDEDTAIYTYRVPEIVNMACMALTKMIYDFRMSTAGIVAVPSAMGVAIKTNMQELLDNFDLPIKGPSFMEFL